MAGPRAGAEALVMERLVLRESSFPLPGRGPHGRQRDREYPYFAPARCLAGTYG